MSTLLCVLVCGCVLQGLLPIFLLNTKMCSSPASLRKKKYSNKLHDFFISTENKEMTLVPGLKLERNRWWCITIEACLNLKQIAKLEQLKIFKVSYLALIFFLPGTSEPPYSNVASPLAISTHFALLPQEFYLVLKICNQQSNMVIIWLVIPISSLYVLTIID